MSTSLYDRATWAAIAVGGMAGATLRWAIGWPPAEPPDGGWFRYEPNQVPAVASDGPWFLVSGFPMATLVANVLGCLLLGGLTLVLGRDASATDRRLLVAATTGFCGSLTTFSSFAVETASLLRGAPLPKDNPAGLLIRVSEPPVGTALAYLIASIVMAGGAFWLGRLAANRLLTDPGSSR